MKAFTYAGDTNTAATVEVNAAAIIAAANDVSDRKGDRVKFAAVDVVNTLCHYYARSKGIPTCALAVDPEHVALLQLKSIDGTIRSHAVAVYAGLLFDSLEPEPLNLTRQNLTRRVSPKALSQIIPSSIMPSCLSMLFPYSCMPTKICISHTSRCLGVEYGGIVRGYVFSPQAKGKKRSRSKAAA